jgi:hypothetical protein
VRLEPGPDPGAGPSNDDALACSLSDRRKAERIAGWAELLGEAGAFEVIEGGRRVSFPVSALIIGRLGELCGAEVDCCSFLSFTLHIDVHAVVLEVTGPDDLEAIQLMEQVFGHQVPGRQVPAP